MYKTKITFTLVTGESAIEILETAVPITSSEQLAIELDFIYTDGGFYPIWNGLISAKHVVSIKFEEVIE